MTMEVSERVYSLHFQNKDESICCVLTLKPQSGEREVYCEISAHTPRFQFKTSHTRPATFDNSGCSWTFENFLIENFLNQAKRLGSGNTMTIVCKLIRLESSTEVCVEAEPAVRSSSGTSQAITRLWRTGLLHDFAITCGGQSFKCHKAILAASSKYFERMFSYDVVETKQNTMEIKEASAQTVADFIEYVYIGKANYTVELLILADRFQMETLKEVCDKAVCDKAVCDKAVCDKAVCAAIDNTNAVTLLSIAHTHSAPLLLSKAVKYVKEKLTTFVATDAWFELVKSKPEAVKLILK